MILEKIFLDGRDQEYFLSYHKDTEMLSFGKESPLDDETTHSVLIHVMDMEEIETLANWVNTVMSKVSDVLDEQSRKRVMLVDKEKKSKEAKRKDE